MGYLRLWETIVPLLIIIQKSESDEKYATKEEVNENKTSILELQVEVNGQRLRGINIANTLIDKLEG